MKLIPETRYGKFIAAAAATVVVLTFLWSGFVWAMDSRYVQHQGLRQEFLLLRITDLNDKIFSLSWEVNNNSATPKDKAMLLKYKNEREELLKHIK